MKREEYQLFIGKVAYVIGMEKTIELLRESKQAFKKHESLTTEQVSDEEIEKIRLSLSLMNSMILSGEQHSETSRQALKQAQMSLDVLSRKLTQPSEGVSDEEIFEELRNHRYNWTFAGDTYIKVETVIRILTNTKER